MFLTLYMLTLIKHNMLTHIMLNIPHTIGMLMFHIHILRLCMVKFIVALIVAGRVTKISFVLIDKCFR